MPSWGSYRSAIMLSSHILSELAEVCTRVAIMERGEIVAQGGIEDIMNMARDEAEVWLRTTDDKRATTVLRELPMVADSEFSEEANHITVKLSTGTDLALLSAHLQDRGIHVRYLERQDPTLEEVFMTLTKGLVQ